MDQFCLGNLGGGCSESVVVEQALEAMIEGKPRLMSVLLEEEEKGGIGANCGGSMEIFIEPVVPKNHLVVFGGGGERSIAGPLDQDCKVAELFRDGSRSWSDGTDVSGSGQNNTRVCRPSCQEDIFWKKHFDCHRHQAQV